ncbi:F-box/LRR-repeat protein 8 [Protopterus annectens]|uniref:F-box/LRR-repeat protein 8 n=1 Tax=Protopterus annectens TaxID=7888 RepID=UPI001CF9410C|nr:F-box/LRR-repeat protein 8 [Protopterus annectens]XP_043937442.1 F-box/LRR-repeat protein 8 [Protopterus annectens]
MNLPEYIELPEEILGHIFSFLPLSDRYTISRVCHTWKNAVLAPALWSYTEISCDFGDKNEECIQWIFTHSLARIKHLKILCDQSQDCNRKNVTRILNSIAEKENKLEGLCIVCCGEHPYFYSGQDILQSIKNLCQSVPECNFFTLKHIDFRFLPFTLDDDLIKLIADGCPNLKSLFINNGTLVCKVSPEIIKEVVRACPQLSALGVFYASLSEDVFMELLSTERADLRYLNLFCNRLNKYMMNFSESLWESLRKRHPLLSVDLVLDHTLPARKIPRILQPNIPISSLELNTFTYMIDQIMFVSTNYNRTLKRLVLQTTSSDKLNSALVDLAKRCSLLEEIHCYCVVSPFVVHTFLSYCPKLKQYTLKITKEVAPWQPIKISH